MATWKKIVVSGSNISQLNNDSNYLTAGTVGTYIPNLFATASWNGTHLLADTTSDALNFESSSGQGLTISANTGTDTLTFGLSAVPNSSLQFSSVTVTAGSGLSDGGAVSLGGSVTLNVGAGEGIVVNADDVALKNGTNLSDNTILKWDNTGNQLTNSIISADSTTVTISGNITVTGTASFQETTSLLVADRFILLASGSTGNGEGGIVVQQTTQNVGELFGWDNNTSRWGVTGSFTATGTTFTPDAYMANAIEGAGSDPTAAPARYIAKGNIFVGTDQTIWIYS